MKNLFIGAALSVLCATAQAQTYDCATGAGTNCPGHIFDASTRGPGNTLSSSLIVPATGCSGPVLAAQVAVKIGHSSIGDLSISLVSPAGSEVQLLSGFGISASDTFGCPGGDIDAVFDDGADEPVTCNFAIPAVTGVVGPAGLLGALVGTPRVGVWTLAVTDSIPGNYGALRDWSLTLPCTLPTVTVAATTAQASSSAPGVFTFTRTTPDDGALLVRFALTGSAAASQYQAVDTSVTIPAGAASADVSILPTVAQGGLTVIATIAGGDFTFDSTKSATITFSGGVGGVASCGDGVAQTGEACDDGNQVNGDGCDDNCTVTACGNGIQTKGEACDDGNQVNGDGCDANCTLSLCGNGVVDPGEECDDGNSNDKDACDNTCHKHSGGCSAAGGDPSLGLAMGLALLFALRRRVRGAVAAGLLAACGGVQAKHPLRGVACSTARCVAVGDATLTSLDGVTWTDATATASLPAIQSIAFGAKTFVAVTKTGEIYSSPDGAYWTKRSLDTDSASSSGSTAGATPPVFDDSFLSVRYAGDQFCVATGNASLLFSTDGASWARQVVEPSFGSQDCAFGHGVFVAVGSPNLIYTSSDTVTWTVATTLGGLPSNVIFGDNLFVAYLFADHSMYSSLDGAKWTAAPLGRAYVINGVSYGSGIFTAVGEAGTILTSPDAVTWSDHSLPGNAVSLLGAAALVSAPGAAVTLDAIVIAGENEHASDGALYTAKDHVHWSAVTSQ
jgi:cysteine-rich repeat protein